MSDLASKKCEACEAGTPPLGEDEAAELHSQVSPDWVLHSDKILREFKFRTFTEAFGMATKVALLAENQGHHPDFEVGWGRLALTLTTHATKGLSENDFIMAAKIDQL